MNAEIKAKWLAALRSGAYRQAHGQLHDGERFCCLGVLCDLHAAAGMGAWHGPTYLGHDSILPRQVSEWAEMGDSSPVVAGEPLTSYNDGYYGDHSPMIREHSFAEIADLIERYL